MIFSLAPSTGQPVTRIDTPLGTILAGSMTPGQLADLLAVVREETGFDVVDPCLPTLLGGGVIAVIGTADSIAEWHYQWDNARLEEHPHDSVGWWMRSTARGAASMWLVSFLTGHELPDDWTYRFGLPWDAESFARCVRALDLLDLSGLIGRLRAFAASDDGYYSWGVIGVRWAELEALHLSGRSDELTAVLTDICRTRADGSKMALAWQPDGSSHAILDDLIDTYYATVKKQAPPDQSVSRDVVADIVMGQLTRLGWRIER